MPNYQIPANLALVPHCNKRMCRFGFNMAPISEPWIRRKSVFQYAPWLFLKFSSTAPRPDGPIIVLITEALFLFHFLQLLRHLLVMLEILMQLPFVKNENCLITRTARVAPFDSGGCGPLLLYHFEKPLV